MIALMRHPTFLRHILNLYPPFIGAGIRVKHISRDFRHVIVAMKLTWYNRNYVGTHFGGSLSAMVDPFYMLILINLLGKEYVVWDLVSNIRFVTPGRGTVTAEFHVTDAQINDIKAQTVDGSKYTPVFTVEIVDRNGELVARAEKQLYIRRKTAMNLPNTE